MMKKALMVLALGMVSIAAHAGVGVAVGHHDWAEDGFPNIGKGEQVKIFTCTGDKHGADLGDCALKKCMAHFKVDPKSEIKTVNKTKLHGGKCSLDGWTSKKGYSVVMAGPKGNNNYIMSKALGDSTREEAMKFVCANDFPCKEATMVLDYKD